MEKSFLSENINNILSIARLAPSVHNSQPWKLKINGDSLVVMLEPSRRLTHGDPTGRQAFISLGIFTEACILGLQAQGLAAQTVEMDGSDVKINAGQKPEAKSTELAKDIKALNNRFSDRSKYDKTEVTAAQIGQLEAAWQSKDVAIKVVTEPDIIETCAVLTKQGLMLALSSPDFRKELAEYLVPSHKKSYGIPVSTLKNSLFRTAAAKRLVSSGAGRAHDSQAEYQRWKSASGLVFILAAGDTPRFWLESGRAYLRASLEIEKLGFRQATSAAIVEASDFHEDVEKLLHTDKRIQCLLRIGQAGGPVKRSGRYTPEELLAT